MEDGYDEIEDTDVDLYDAYERNYEDIDVCRCKLCGEKLVKRKEQHTAWGSDFNINVFICNNPDCWG